MTTRKTKPDGSNEVTHKVEHSFDPIPFMKKMKRMDGSIGRKDADGSRDTHAAIIHGTPHSRSPDWVPDAIAQMRKHNTTAGDGRLERPAPAFSDVTPDNPGYPYNDEDPYAVGYGVSHQAGDAESQPVSPGIDPSLIPFMRMFLERQRQEGSQDF
jgi:hypothetical protein